MPGSLRPLLLSGKVPSLGFGLPGVDVRPSIFVTMEKGLVDENDVWHVVEAERLVPETELDWMRRT